jgi:hypothetical protein
MSTISRRGATWTNSDGLVVGFGPHNPPREGATQRNASGDLGGVKVAALHFDWKDMNAANSAGAVNVPIPAGSRVINVRVVCHTAWTCTGTNTFIVGDGNDDDGYITTSVGTSGSMTAGAVLNADGVYAFGATDTGASELKASSAADTIDLYTAMTDWLSGEASLIVTYV